MRISMLMMTLGLFTVAFGCSKQEKEQQQETIQATKVETSSLTKQNFQKKIRVQGTVIPVDEMEISARTNGNLNELPIKEGSAVKKGDLLFQIDRKNLENRVAVAEQELAVARDNVQIALAELEIAKTTYEKSLLDFKRAERLIDAKAISVDDFENTRMNHKNAEGAVKKCESVLSYNKTKAHQEEILLEIARKNLEDSRELAPFNGIVTAKYKELGEYVTSSTPILHLENPARYEISCMISAVYHPAVTVGKTRGNIFFDQYKICDTSVNYKASNIDPLSRTFELKFAVPENLEIISGVLCNVDMILEERQGFGIPAEAVLLRKGGEYQTYVVRDNKAEAIAVTPGITSNGFTEILNADSLKHEIFVVSGQNFLNDGDPVTVTSEPAKER